MISGHANIDNAVQAPKDGALDFIEKPFETERLLTTLRRTLETEKLRKQNQELIGKLGGEAEMIGTSSAATLLRSAISKVAPTGSRVMIQGPSGSGKEVTARMIHEQSSRRSGPFVVLYAPMLLPERVEEELFGVEDALNDDHFYFCIIPKSDNDSNGYVAKAISRKDGSEIWIDYKSNATKGYLPVFSFKTLSVVKAGPRKSLRHLMFSILSLYSSIDFHRLIYYVL